MLKSLSCISQNYIEITFKYFTIGQVTQNNQTTCEFPRILSSGRSPGTIRPLVSFFVFYHWAGCLEQLEHSQNSLLSSLSGRVSSHFIIGQVAWNNQTTCEFPRILLSGRSPGTIRPLASFLTFYHRGGHLENRTNAEITFMYFTKPLLKSLSCISQNKSEITFMYFTRPMLKSLSCIPQNHC